MNYPRAFGSIRVRLFGGIAVLTMACCAHAGSLLFVGDGGTFSLDTFSATNGAPVHQDNVGNSLGFPTGIAFGSSGNVYLADSYNGVIDSFSGTTGTFISPFVTAGNGLTQPSGIAFGPNGNLYVADYGTGGGSYIDEFNGTTGAFLEQLVAPGAGGLDDPNGIAFGADGLYVADEANGITIFNATTGAYEGVLVGLGSGPGLPAGLSGPSGITIGPNGDLFVADETNGVVDEFNAVTGAFLGVFGATNILDQPIDLAFGPDGNLYVTDANGVEEFNGTTGAFIGTFIQGGVDTLENPQYLAFNTAPSSVPEPSSFAFLAGGAGLLVLFRRRLCRG